MVGEIGTTLDSKKAWCQRQAPGMTSPAPRLELSGVTVRVTPKITGFSVTRGPGWGSRTHRWSEAASKLLAMVMKAENCDPCAQQWGKKLKKEKRVPETSGEMKAHDQKNCAMCPRPMALLVQA